MQTLGIRMFLWAACFSLASSPGHHSNVKRSSKQQASKSWKKCFFLEAIMWGSQLSTDSFVPQDRRSSALFSSRGSGSFPAAPGAPQEPTSPLLHCPSFSMLQSTVPRVRAIWFLVLAHHITSLSLSVLIYWRRSYTSQGQYQENKILSVALGLTLATSAK